MLSAAWSGTNGYGSSVKARKKELAADSRRMREEDKEDERRKQLHAIETGGHVSHPTLRMLGHKAFRFAYPRMRKRVKHPQYHAKQVEHSLKVGQERARVSLLRGIATR